MLGNEPLHHLNTPAVLDHFDGHPALSEQLFLPLKRDVFTDNDSWDPVQQDGPGAHGTRGQCRIEDALPVCRGGQSAGIFECVHLGVEHGTSPLNASVVSPTDDFPLMDQNGTDRNSAFGKSLFRFGNRYGKMIHMTRILQKGPVRRCQCVVTP